MSTGCAIQVSTPIHRRSRRNGPAGAGLGSRLIAEQKEGYSIDAELRATWERAANHGWNVVREFSVAESAKRGATRQTFNDMDRWEKRTRSVKISGRS